MRTAHHAAVHGGARRVQEWRREQPPEALLPLDLRLRAGRLLLEAILVDGGLPAPHGWHGQGAVPCALVRSVCLVRRAGCTQGQVASREIGTAWSLDRGAAHKRTDTRRRNASALGGQMSRAPATGLRLTFARGSGALNDPGTAGPLAPLGVRQCKQAAALTVAPSCAGHKQDSSLQLPAAAVTQNCTFPLCTRRARDHEAAAHASASAEPAGLLAVDSNPHMEQ